MTRILHLTETASWEAAQEAGVYRQSTRGATFAEVGYIHCSAPDQLPVVASFIYADYSGGLVVLELDATAIAAAGIAIRFEDGGNGELFPHLYGELKTGWVPGHSPGVHDRRDAIRTRHRTCERNHNVSAQQPQANGTALRSGRPLATWILMLIALAITLLLPNWTGTGALLPAWFMVVPVLLGLVGAWLAYRAGRLGWAIASAVLGLVLVPGLLQTITLVSGP